MITKARVNSTTEVSTDRSPLRTPKYLTAPVPTTKMPPGVPYIIGNEAAERFSFYGMRTILVVFMTKFLMNAHGNADHMTDKQADVWFHLFVSAVYFFPLIGSIVADVFLGKYMTIISLSVVYCLGHLALSLNDTRLGLSIGLTLIAIGSGGIKPCVSSNVGDQFGSQNRHLLSRVYLWFYLSINIGSAISMYWIPTLLRNPKYGPHVAFGVPGLLMFIATVVFWMGRKKMVHVPPAREVREAFDLENIEALWRLLPIFAVIAVFWSLYDQCSSTWVQQAEHMNLHVNLYFYNFDWTADQFQILNPIFVLIYVPLFSLVIYPVVGKFVTLTPLRKMSVGFFFTVASYLVPAWVETQISAGLKPTIAWQILAYAFLMISEVMVYATGLEFTYAQAPKKMKSMVMALFLATNTAGNLFTAAVNFFIQKPDGTTKLTGANYYLFFAGLMFAAALCFIVIAIFYRGRTFIQDDDEVQPSPA